MTKKHNLEDEEEELEKEIEVMESVDYGLKELVQGILIGLVLGFALAWFVLS